MKKTLEEIDEEFIKACWNELDLPISIRDSDSIAERYKEHAGHNIEIGLYTAYNLDLEEEVCNVAIECEDCYEVLFDSDVPENAPNAMSRAEFLEGEDHNF